MINILLISDTHGHLDEKLGAHIRECDEVWHAGDIGSSDLLNALEKQCKTIAVYGNIDGGDLRTRLHKTVIFERENIKILMTHIAGSPGKYPDWLAQLIRTEKPMLLVCGHSHILKVTKDEKFGILHINPGACGIHGFHHIKTVLKMTLHNGKITAMSAIELGKRSAIS